MKYLVTGGGKLNAIPQENATPPEEHSQSFHLTSLHPAVPARCFPRLTADITSDAIYHSENFNLQYLALLLGSNSLTFQEYPELCKREV
jgi:hypothetical protein